MPVGGDVAVGIGGRAVRIHEALMRYLVTETRPGEPSPSVIRDEERRTLTVVLNERPAAAPDRVARRRHRRGGDRGDGGRSPVDWR